MPGPRSAGPLPRRQTCAPPRGAGVTAAAVDGAEPEDHDAGAGGGNVVTGDGRSVDGRDPATGAALWSYARDLDLCGVTSVYNYAVAVYPDVRGCGQVSTIDARPACAAQPHQLRRPRSPAVRRRHHRAVGRGQPAGAVALGHGPDVVLRLTGRADQAGHSRLADLPPGIGRGQLSRRVGAGGVPEAGRPATDAVAAGR